MRRCLALIRTPSSTRSPVESRLVNFSGFVRRFSLCNLLYSPTKSANIYRNRAIYDFTKLRDTKSKVRDPRILTMYMRVEKILQRFRVDKFNANKISRCISILVFVAHLRENGSFTFLCTFLTGAVYLSHCAPPPKMAILLLKVLRFISCPAGSMLELR